VDDLMLHSESAKMLLMTYLPIILEILQKYIMTVKLNKYRLFSMVTEFVGIDIKAPGNRPAKSKVQAFNDLKLNPPVTVVDQKGLKGMIGFYHEWIPLFEIRIQRYQKT
jgi:hypothetical protein